MSDFKSYFGTAPSDQNAFDLFSGEWSSRPPAAWAGLKAGETPLFSDPRITWAHDRLTELGLEGGFAGRDVITDFHPARTDVAAVLRTYAEDQQARSLPLRGSETMQTWSGLPETIRHSRALITGRHHGVCLAIVARVPFVALGSNTYKIEGMLEMLGLERLYCETLEDVYEARAFATDHADIFAQLLERLTGGEELSTFRALGRDGTDREAAEVQRLKEDVGDVVL